MPSRDSTLADPLAELHATAAERLRSQDQRYTSSRRALVAVLAAAGKPLTIGDIMQADPTLAQSSAYRNLVLLEQAEVVHRVVTGEEFARYELAEDLTAHHHHLVCTSCGTVQDVTIPGRLERSMERTVEEVAGASGFSEVSHRLDLMGLCRACG